MANPLDFLNWARSSRAKPQRVVDGQNAPIRMGQMQELYSLPLFPTKHLLADEGSYFTLSSASQTAPYNYGTTVAQQAQITAFSDTGPLWVLFNKDAANGKRIYLDYLRLLLGGTAPTGTISLEAAVRVDVISKLPTNSNQYTTPTMVNQNGDDGTGSICVPYAYLAAQALVTPASSGAVRNAGRGRIPTGVAVVGDEYVFQFGGVDRTSIPGITAARATGPARLIGDMPPVIIGPQQWATIHLWWLTSATNLPTWEWEIGVIER